MSSIVVSGDTSGAVTLSAPAVAGTVTVTLPSASGTMASLASVTANGVSYVNSSGQPTSGSALTFDGTLGLTTNGVTQGFNTNLYTVDGTLSNYSATNNVYLNGNVAGGLSIRGSGNGAQAIGMDGAASGVITFTTNSSERARFNSTGALVFAGGTTTANGIGITFPATQSASSDANTLDDYEEGTWTPGVSFGGGTTGITYTTQLGQYTKIGRQVTVTANVTLSSKGSSTGDATLTGLPFTNSTARSVGSIYIASVTFADSPSILVEASNTIAYFRETTNAGVATDLTNADFANNSNWTATITYFV